MTPTHANKKGTRYRYYVSRSLITRDRSKGSDAGRRVPAGDVESLIEDRTLAFLRDAPAVFDAVKSVTSDLKEAEALVRDAAGLAGRWRGLATLARRAMLHCLIARIEVRRETVEIWIRPSAIPSIVDSGFDPARPPIAHEIEPTLIVSIPARLKRTGMDTKLLIDGGGPRREPDRSLLRLLARAQRFSLMVMQSEGKTISDLAGESGVSPSYFTRILRLSFLAPDIVSAILSDRHPLELTAKRISLTDKLPNAWSEQKALLGTA